MSRVRKTRWTGCRRTGAVVLPRVEGSGHNCDSESAEEIWHFYRRCDKATTAE